MLQGINETPQSEATPYECMQDAGGDALEVYVQSSAAKTYDDTLA